jgi:hypothetical protein
MAVGAKNSTQFDKIGAINGVPEVKIGSLGPVDFLSISRSMYVSGEAVYYADGGSYLCMGTGVWDVSANAPWYITYPTFMEGHISPTSGTGNATIICYSVDTVGSGNIDFFWSGDDIWAGYRFGAISAAECRAT